MNFGRWIDVLVEHEYFGGRCADFCFLPDADTKKMLADERVLMRETAWGFRLAFSNDDCDGKFVFWAQTNRHELWSVSAFDSKGANEIPIAHFDKKGLRWNSCLESDLLKSMKLPKPMFGLEIVVCPEMRNSCLVIPLKTRRLRWRYCVLGYSKKDSIEVVSVRGKDENVSFDAKEMDLNSVMFTSHERIPLRLGAPPRFQLREKKTSKPIIKCLPNMDARSLAMASLDEGKFELVAETFIYT